MRDDRLGGREYRCPSTTHDHGDDDPCAIGALETMVGSWTQERWKATVGDRDSGEPQAEAGRGIRVGGRRTSRGAELGRTWELKRGQGISQVARLSSCHRGRPLHWARPYWPEHTCRQASPCRVRARLQTCCAAGHREPDP